MWEGCSKDLYKHHKGGTKTERKKLSVNVIEETESTYCYYCGEKDAVVKRRIIIEL